MDINYIKIKNNVHIKNNNRNLKNFLKNDFRTIFLIILVIISLAYTNILWTAKSKSNDFTISFAQNQHVIKISDKFLSFGLDFSLMRHPKKLPINQSKFVNLLKHLSPAYIRIGGTAADCAYFNLSRNELITEEQVADNTFLLIDKSDDISNFTVMSNNFLSLYKFTEKAGTRMLFDLNVLLRNPDGSWNSDNAAQIINFAKAHQMEIDWQLGNEPNSFFHVFKVKISAEQLAKDYCDLRNLLNYSGYKESLLVGPEANHIGDSTHNGEIYAETFLNNINNCIDFVTWHQYYLNGHIAQVQDFINVTVFNYLPMQIRAVERIIKRSKQNITMWISETSSAYGGGAPELSDRFVAGFLWLDKLGCSAKAAVQVVIRQTFFGGNYAMVGPDLEPNPDWWVAVLYKKFVSQKVLNLTIPNNHGKVRLYAHCATKARAVVIYGVNLDSIQSKIHIQGQPKDAKIYSYFLTSENLQSRNIFMNEKILKLKSDGSLPDFTPLIIKGSEPVLVPSYSMFFLVIQRMEVTACL